MEGVEIPSFLLCPISLDIMRDPVTLSTGITYDRSSIERWMYSGNHRTCPVTRQTLPDFDHPPNHTLRRLIQSWCTANASNGIERFPTPRPPVDKTQIVKLLNDAEAELPQSLMSSLRKLNAIVSESERNKRCVEATPGAVDFLVSIITNSSYSSREETTNSACDEALNILNSLQISEQGLVDLVARNGDLINSLTSTFQRSNYQSRAHTTLLLKSIIDVINPTGLISLKEELFQEIVNVLHDQISHQATKAALQILGGLCPWGRNRIKAVLAGAVPVLIELLVEEPERRVCEMVLVVLDWLCGRAEGRAAMVAHAAGIAVVSKKILSVSEVASERAVRILCSVAKFSGSPAVVQEMLQVGAVSKMCLLLQVDCETKAKEKARGVLRLHSRVWKKSPCVFPHLRALYPSS